jgi:hypothetical protein
VLVTTSGDDGALPASVTRMHSSRIACLLGFVLGCTGEVLPAQECRVVEVVKKACRQSVDVLVVVDHGMAMEEKQSSLREYLQHFSLYLEHLGGRGYPDSTPDLRVAAISAQGDGSLLGGKVLIDAPEGETERVRNYSGTLADALEAIVVVGADSPAPSTPLEAIRLALLKNPKLVRPGALWVVQVISAGDDHSPASVTTYRDLLYALKEADPRRLLVSVVAPFQGRLFALVLQMDADCSFAVNIDGHDWRNAVPWRPGSIAIDIPALPEDADTTDLDPAAPGLQLGCELVHVSGMDDSATERTVPTCPLGDDGRIAPGAAPPCWWVEPDSFTVFVYHHRPIASGQDVLRCPCRQPVGGAAPRRAFRPWYCERRTRRRAWRTRVGTSSPGRNAFRSSGVWVRVEWAWCTRRWTGGATIASP